jgi:thioredoxin-like negative regulator of GroEL
MRAVVATYTGMTKLVPFDPASTTTTGVQLLDFGAERCGPCRAMEPILEALAVEYAPRAKIFTIDCDRDPALAEKFGVRSMPTLVLLRDGREVGRVVGSRSRAFVAGVLDRALRGDVAITAP